MALALALPLTFALALALTLTLTFTLPLPLTLGALVGGPEPSTSSQAPFLRDGVRVPRVALRCWGGSSSHALTGASAVGPRIKGSAGYGQ